jgi:hypothetical protein
VPIYTDFTQWGVAWLQALNGQTTSLYDPTEFIKIQTAPAGPGVIYATWPYPPTLLLILAPLAALPYVAAFLVWDLLTSAGCIGTVYLIVRRLPEIALVLACPFTAWNFVGGQNSCLTRQCLVRRYCSSNDGRCLRVCSSDVLPINRIGILVPLALIASRQWRCFVSAGGHGCRLGQRVDRGVRHRRVGCITSTTLCTNQDNTFR